MNFPFNGPDFYDPAFDASLRAAYSAADEIFARNREQIEHLTSGVFDNFAASALLPENQMFDRALSIENESIKRLQAAATANYPNIFDLISGDYLPTTHINVPDVAEDALARINDALLASLNNVPDLTDSFYSVIESNFDTSATDRLIALALDELIDDDVATAFDDLLATIPAPDSSLSIEDKANRITSLIAEMPTTALTVALILGVHLMHLGFDTTETGKLKDVADIYGLIFAFLVAVREEYKKKYG